MTCWCCGIVVEDIATQDHPNVTPSEVFAAGLLNSPVQTLAPRSSFILVVRVPEQLRIHPALEELALIGALDEVNETAQFQSDEPIPITKNGVVLGGFGRWRLALLQGIREVQCIEYPIGEEDAIQFILNHCKPRRGWNAFARIQLALTLEPALQRRALDNMRAGGKYKGLANLPEGQRLDVRQQIARAAGVGVRNVSNVKTILKTAHPRLVAALREGRLTINAAIQLCKLSKSEQLERFIRRSDERETNKVIRRSIARPKEQTTSPDAAILLDSLRQQESRRPGSVVVRLSPCQHTVILVGQDLLTQLHSHEELKLT
jgi:hypothetical protein